MTRFELEPVKEVTVLVDWSNALYFLGPSRKTNRRDPTKSAEQVLCHLRGIFKSVTLSNPPPPRIETLLFGGFTDGNGNPTREYLALSEAIPRVQWVSRTSEGFRFTSPRVIRSLPGSRRSLSALFRPRMLLKNAHLRLPADKPCCKWCERTNTWIRSERNGKRYCPVCSSEERPVEVSLVRDEQKLVDLLLSCWAFFVASSYCETADERDGEIWIVSSDADFVPVLATLRLWGLRVVWIQPQLNRRYGYRSLLRDLGVDVYDCSQLSEVPDDKT